MLSRHHSTTYADAIQAYATCINYHYMRSLLIDREQPGSFYLLSVCDVPDEMASDAEAAASPERQRIDDAMMNHRHTNPSPPSIPVATRWDVWNRDNFTCVTCGSRNLLTIDHIYPRSKGGSNDPDNLQTMCKSCNSSKGAR